MHDEAEIRGTGTYTARCPEDYSGTEAGETNDPVMMRDEVDKLGRDFRATSSALMEVLDPEQKTTRSAIIIGCAVRSLKSAVHRHGELDGFPSLSHCVTAWRSSNCPATREKRSCTSRTST